MSEPNIPQKAPYIKDMAPGKYAWCSCGLSENQPLCDGSHRGSDAVPLIVEIADNQKVAWCGCKHSHTKPFCDGSHGDLES